MNIETTRTPETPVRHAAEETRTEQINRPMPGAQDGPCCQRLAPDEEEIDLSFTESLCLYDLDPCPTAGSGVHSYILQATSALVREGVKNDARIHEVLRHKTRQCGRVVTHTEIQDAINGARNFHEGRGGKEKKAAPTRVPRLPAPVEMPPDEALEIRRKFIAESPVRSLAALHSLSSPIPDTPEEILEGLLPGNPLILLKQKHLSCGSVYRLRNPMVELRRYPSFCPNPALGFTARRLSDGKESPSIKENFPVRLHIIVESDCLEMNWDEKAAILGQIGRRLPLVLVTYSGGKSLHGIYAYDESRDLLHLRWLIQSSGILGIDPAPLRNAACTTRMPWAVRQETGRVQIPYFFNPNPTLFQ